MIPTFLCNNNAMEFNIECNEIYSQYSNSWILNNSLLADECVKEEAKKEIKDFWN